MTDFLQIAAVLLTTAGAVAVVANRNVTNLAIVLGFYGLAVLVLFVAYQMPDVALSQLAVGAVPPPLLVLLAIARIRRIDQKRHDKQAAEHN
jgi:energy-converting hydrogenase B subunit D